jgi:Fe-S-cluster-containing hydrogenase component 2
MKIRRIPEKCYGCRSCELACSFHHRGAFSPGGGSIRAFKDHETGAIHWQRDRTCDFCRGEERPWCIRFCSYEALEIVNEEKPIENR